MTPPCLAKASPLHVLKRRAGITKRTAFIFLAVMVSVLHAHEPHFYTLPESDFIKGFGGPQVIQMIRSSRRVEAVLVKVDNSDPKKAWGDRKLIELGKPFEIDEKIAGRAGVVLTDYQTFKSYEHSFSMCIFDPGVKIIFHASDGGNVTLLICLRCDQLSISKNGKEAGFLGFDQNDTAVLEVAADIFPKDKNIKDMLARSRKNARERSRAEEKSTRRWIAAAPKPLRPVLVETVKQDKDIDIKNLGAPLEAGCPDKNRRILALLEWSGLSPYRLEGRPIYEYTADELLEEYTGADIFAALQSTHLNDRQKLGALRIFMKYFEVKKYAQNPDKVAAWSKTQKKALRTYLRDRDLGKMPPALKQILRTYCLKNPDSETTTAANLLFNP